MRSEGSVNQETVIHGEEIHVKQVVETLGCDLICGLMNGEKSFGKGLVGLSSLFL